mmetsp:Transcript_67649/g.144782  ORF Transcript_67649/g.144782 Transcript_67649/m.144782 type:complete len:230 (-) Transcript_67649:650-1339(-)
MAGRPFAASRAASAAAQPARRRRRPPWPPSPVEAAKRPPTSVRAAPPPRPRAAPSPKPSPGPTPRAGLATPRPGARRPCEDGAAPPSGRATRPSPPRGGGTGPARPPPGATTRQRPRRDLCAMPGSPHAAGPPRLLKPPVFLPLPLRRRPNGDAVPPPALRAPLPRGRASAAGSAPRPRPVGGSPGWRRDRPGAVRALAAAPLAPSAYPQPPWQPGPASRGKARKPPPG